MTLSLGASTTGLFLMSAAQDRIAQASNQIREILLPAGRLIGDARSEIDLQIQELGLLSASSPQVTLGAQNLGLLRLGPNVKSLLSLHSSPLMPQVLRPLFDPWAKTAYAYQAEVMSFGTLSQAIAPLKALSQKTQLLNRAVDREFSVQLLELGSTLRDYTTLWSAAFLLTALCSLIFGLLVWRWLSPLERMRRWLFESSAEMKLDAPVGGILPPPSLSGSGLRSAPAEVQNLNEALRAHVAQFLAQRSELETRSQRTRETEKAMGTLFAALQHLTRNNAQLVDELVKKERLASMTEMAARLAHEIRNPLNSLNLKLELLREDLVSEVQRAQLDRVLGEIDRLDALTESHLRTTRAQLEGHSAGGAAGEARQAAICAPAEVAADTLETMRPELEAAGIELSAEGLADSELEARLPANILKAALMNLVKNAVEALREVATPRQLRVTLNNRARGAWTLSVDDSGCGFPPDYLAHGIESFRTTKVHGSGLGLATAQKMLAAYGARIQIASRLGAGDDARSPYRTRVSLEWDPPPLPPGLRAKAHPERDDPNVERAPAAKETE